MGPKVSLFYHRLFFLLIFLSLTLSFLKTIVVRTHSSLESVAEDGTYVSYLDSNYDPDEDEDDNVSNATDAVSQLSFDDGEYTLETRSTAFKSRHSSGTKKTSGQETGRSSSVARDHKFSGPTKLTLPYLLDLWRDGRGRGRMSIQVHMMSGDKAWSVVIARVSTSQKQVVLSFPMSGNLGRSDFALQIVAAHQPDIMKMGEANVKMLLAHHPKCIARMTAASKVTGRDMTNSFKYEMRINCPKKASYKWAKASDGDQIFHGAKFFEYANGEVMLHLELLVDTKDNFCPEECLATTPMMITDTRRTTLPRLPNGKLLANDIAEEDDEEARRAAKRIRDEEDANSKTIEETAKEIMDDLDQALEEE